MEKFVARFGSSVTAVLSGFDRLVFRGGLRSLLAKFGRYGFLTRSGVRLLDFGDYARRTSDRVKDAAEAEARQQGRPLLYLPSAATDKEAQVQQILREQPTEGGLVCTFKTLELGLSFEYHRSAGVQQRGLRPHHRKCLHLYKYYLHPRFGLIGARLQTWFPFNVQVWMNGREWLAVQLRAAGVQARRQDNCFTWLGDPTRAQALMDEQLKTHWPTELDAIARQLNPLHDEIFGAAPQTYYCSAHQTEWATDILFDEPATLAGVYPAMVKHAMAHFSSPDVMRFLGRKLHHRFEGQLTTSFKRRVEGVRVKHWVHGNSLKMYDKAGSVLRVETTIGNPDDFKVYRPKQGDAEGDAAKLQWLPMRKGVADLHRRAEVSNQANARYLDALAVAEAPQTVGQLLDGVSHRVRDGKRVLRALRVGDPADLALLQAVADARYAVCGFRNADIRLALQPGKTPPSDAERKRQAARVSRLLRLLRVHGVIQKIPKSRRYRLTAFGQSLTAALHGLRNVPVRDALRLVHRDADVTASPAEPDSGPLRGAPDSSLLQAA